MEESYWTKAETEGTVPGSLNSVVNSSHGLNLRGLQDIYDIKMIVNMGGRK
jgi:hypothetical protein